MLIRGMTYSIDLRQRVVDYVERGGSKASAVRVFNVSRGTIYNWFGRESLMPTKVYCPPMSRPKIGKMKGVLGSHTTASYKYFA